MKAVWMKRSLMIFFALIIIAAAAHAATINVPADYATLQEAITAANDTDTIVLSAGDYVEIGQIVISGNITIQGTGNPVIRPAQDTGLSGTSSAWILVTGQLKLDNVTLNCSGHKISEALRVHGIAEINNVRLSDVSYLPLSGFGIVDYSKLNISNSQLEGIQRTAVQVKGITASASIQDNTITGVGAADFAQYGIEVLDGASATITYNHIQQYLGILDFTGSAGVYVRSYTAPCHVELRGNTIDNCYMAVYAAQNGEFSSPLSARLNLFNQDLFGVNNLGAEFDAANNWWGSSTGPHNPITNPQGTGAEVSDKVLYDPWLVQSSMCVANALPSAMFIGQTEPVSLTMRNNGNFSWGTSHALGSANANWGFTRVIVNALILPGEEYTFNYSITAPLTPGNYSSQWRMGDAQEWFGDNCGKTIKVTYNCTDVDHDGYNAISSLCPSGNDCNDQNHAVNPGASDANCNNVDDNCDGQTDEEYRQTNTTCGIGACSSTGSLTCSNGREINACTPSKPSPDNNCNGVDDNCDGVVDEDCAAAPASWRIDGKGGSMTVQGRPIANQAFFPQLQYSLANNRAHADLIIQGRTSNGTQVRITVGFDSSIKNMWVNNNDSYSADHAARLIYWQNGISPVVVRTGSVSIYWNKKLNFVNVAGGGDTPFRFNVTGMPVKLFSG